MDDSTVIIILTCVIAALGALRVFAPATKTKADDKVARLGDLATPYLEAEIKRRQAKVKTAAVVK